MPTFSEITGQPVDTSSEDWRHECECRHVLDGFPDKSSRNMWLYGDPDGVRDAMGRIVEDRVQKKSVAHIRGIAAADRIREGAIAIANARKAARQKP